jgi:hypothetical protein
VSDSEPAIVPLDAPLAVPVEDPATTTAGATSPAPPEADEPIAAAVAACPSCGHALDAHAAGRCLIMRGDFGTEGACPCPEVAA